MEGFCKLLGWLREHPKTKVTVVYLDELGAFELRVRDTNLSRIESGAAVVVYDDALDKIIDKMLGGAGDAMREM